MPARTLMDKVWDSHLIDTHGGVHADGGADLLYVDLHLVQEVSSPQAFEQLRQAGLPVRRPDLTVATTDHSLPTIGRGLQIADDQARQQVEALARNCRDFGITHWGPSSPKQGIVHVIGPEQGLSQPGMTIVCGDSHTTTHGAFGALAFGIGSSEVAHVLATQTLRIARPKRLRVRIDGAPGLGVTAKDIALGMIAAQGSAAATGHAIEYQGSTVAAMSMEARMTLCNMAIEGGARIGMIAPDDVTYAYLAGRQHVRTDVRTFDELVAQWQRLPSDPDAEFDAAWEFRASDFEPMVTWGTTPAMAVAVNGTVPLPEDTADPQASAQALTYMGLRGGEALSELPLQRVFIGSCTNARIEDLRTAAAVVQGRRVASGVEAMVVPGSTAVRIQAEREGLDRTFVDAGFQWRESGCSMCVAMNGDALRPGERCASTSNRNFQGRQGAGGRTHLVSPAMAAGAAVYGHFVDVRDLDRDDRGPLSEEL